jgi:sulfatase maturation enzyme AslB (radical SAM superfamily)
MMHAIASTRAVGAPRRVRVPRAGSDRARRFNRRATIARCAPPSSTADVPSERFGSLVKETLREMETDEEFQTARRRLKEEGQAALTKEERARRRRALDGLDVPHFDEFIVQNGADPLVRKPTTILQVNIGLYCNQACSHCHVESSPLRTSEVMSKEVADRIVELIDAADGSIGTLDITGGAPELMEQFRPLVIAARARGVDVIDRCNLTVLYEPGQEDLPQFLAENGVQVVASLPCYSKVTRTRSEAEGFSSGPSRRSKTSTALGTASRGPA